MHTCIWLIRIPLHPFVANELKTFYLNIAFSSYQQMNWYIIIGYLVMMTFSAHYLQERLYYY